MKGKDKKMIAGLVVSVIVLGIIAYVPSAAAVIATTEVSIHDASADPGSTVTVPIKITDVTDLCGANVWLNYNPNVVIVESVSNGDLGSITYSIDNDAGVTKMNWDTTTGMTGDFVFAYITLKAVGSPGDTSPLDLDVKELYDCNLDDITHTAADGTFTIPSVAPTPSPNEVYLDPQDSSARHCNTEEVKIWANTTDTFGYGQINLTYTHCCANVTGWSYGPLWQGTWDSSINGIEWLVFTRPFGQPTVSGTVLIGTLTIHCCNTSDCITPLTFSPPSKLSDPVAGTLTVTWKDGTFTCEPITYDFFDTGPGTYPSIPGMHKGTIKPSNDINVSKMYTYPCINTGGHTEYVWIYGNGVDVSKTWSGYTGDYYNITFDAQFILEAGKTYNYTIRTGSYPQIIHEHSKSVTGGTITCTDFIDANGNKHSNMIPAIRLFRD